MGEITDLDFLTEMVAGDLPPQDPMYKSIEKRVKEIEYDRSEGIGLNLTGYIEEDEPVWTPPENMDLDFWEGLVKETPKHVFCGVPTLTKEELEWRESNYDRSHWPETFPCEFCGHCPTPGQCVRSVTCPRCWRMAGYSCSRPNDSTIIEPYHIERWELVRSQYGTWYT